MLKPAYMFDKVLGMSQAAAAHLIPQDKWWFTYNARFHNGRVEQTPPIVVQFTATSGSVGSITGLVPFRSATSSLLISLHGGGADIINLESNTTTVITQPGGFATDADSMYRWSTISRDGKIYYSNLLNSVITYNGSGAATTLVVTGIAYKAKYIEEFYDHLVVANVLDGSTPYPLRVAYSDITDWTDFDPTTTNEADFFELTSNELNSLYGLGITGLKRLGEVCAIYTPGSIWNMRYVGFDNGVMQFTEQIQGIGAWLPYSVVGLDRYHLFISADDIYLYDGTQAVSIGGDIRDFFYTDLSTDPVVRNRTWGFIDVLRQEVRWNYPSRESTMCNKSIVFNWQTKHWYAESAQYRSASLVSGVVSNSYIDLLPLSSATIDGLAAVFATIDGMANSSVSSATLFAVSTDNKIYRERLLTDSSSDYLENGETILETGDITFGDNQEVKEIDTILFDAEAAHVTTSTSTSKFGWEIWVSTRDYISSSIEYSLYGLFEGTEVPKRVTSPRLSGRIFRFKFISKLINFSKFYGFAPNVDAGSTER